MPKSALNLLSPSFLYNFKGSPTSDMALAQCILEVCWFFFFCFFFSVLCAFQDYFSSYETVQSVGGANTENTGTKHFANLLQT